MPIVPTEEEKTVKLQEIAAEKRIDYVPKNEVKHNLNNIVPPQGFAPNYQQENLYPRVPTYNPSAAPYQAPGQGYGQGQYQQPPQGQYQPSPQGLYQPSPQGVYQPPQGQYQPPSAGYQSYPLQDPNISQPPYNPSGQNYPTTSPLDFNPRQQPANIPPPNIPPPNIPKTETRQPPPRPQTPPEPAVLLG